MERARERERESRRRATTGEQQSADADFARTSVNRDLMASQLDFTIALCPRRRHFTLTDQIRTPLSCARARSLCDTLTAVLPLNPLAYATFVRNRRSTYGLRKLPFPYQRQEEEEQKKRESEREILTKGPARFSMISILAVWSEHINSLSKERLFSSVNLKMSPGC